MEDAEDTYEEGDVNEEGDDEEVIESGTHETEQITPEVIMERLKENMEGILDRKKVTRETSLKNLLNLMQMHYCPNELEGHTVELADNLARCMRKGGNIEREMCMNIIATLLLTKRSNDMVDTWDATMRQYSTDPAASVSARAAACRAMAVMYFVIDLDMKRVVEACNFILNECRKKQSMSAEILRSWCLLVSCLQPRHLPDIWRSSFKFFAKCIEEESLEIKMAAGEAVALLYDMFRDADIDITTLEAEVQAEDTLTKIKEMSHQTTKHTAKKERSTQKSTFRFVAGTIFDQTTPASTLKLQQGEIEFEGWTDRMRLSTFRDILQSGLQHHLVNNVLFSDVFGYDLGDVSVHTVSRGDIETKHMRSVIKKIHKQERLNQRAAKEAALKMQ